MGTLIKETDPPSLSGSTPPSVNINKFDEGYRVVFLDGTSFAWVNTSAVSTAGFFGNAAVLLAGVYLLRKVYFKFLELFSLIKYSFQPQ